MRRRCRFVVIRSYLPEKIRYDEPGKRGQSPLILVI